MELLNTFIQRIEKDKELLVHSIFNTVVGMLDDGCKARVNGGCRTAHLHGGFIVYNGHEEENMFSITVENYIPYDPLDISPKLHITVKEDENTIMLLIASMDKGIEDRYNGLVEKIKNRRLE